MDLSKELKNIVLAGIGAVAVTAEKSQALLDELVKKGELTVEQGKVLNEELKHNVQEKIKQSVTVKVEPESGEELLKVVDQLTPEQLQALKEKLSAMESKPAQEEAHDDAGSESAADKE